MSTEITTETRGPTIPEFKSCAACGTTYRLWDANGDPLPRPARPRGRPKAGSAPAGPTLPFALIHAKRYSGGVRLRDVCDACHAANEAERGRAKRQRERESRGEE
jgi:hypothetical protein